MDEIRENYTFHRIVTEDDVFPERGSVRCAGENRSHAHDRNVDALLVGSELLRNGERLQELRCANRNLRVQFGDRQSADSQCCDLSDHEHAVGALRVFGNGDELCAFANETFRSNAQTP